MLLETVFAMPHELRLTKKQFRALVRDVHNQMMKGGAGDYGAPAQIPDFSGQDIGFFVEDGGMEGGGWRDTLSSVWNSVKKHVLSSPLAQKAVDATISKGKQLARSAADDVVGKALDYVPEALRAPAQGLANKALDGLQGAAESKARGLAKSAGIGGSGLVQAGSGLLQVGSGHGMHGTGLVMSGSGNGVMAPGSHTVSPFNHLTAKGSY
jgi:hypothetical protein